MSDDLKLPDAHDRRQMLVTSARSLAAVAIVASAAIVARTKPAEAQEPRLPNTQSVATASSRER